MASCRTCGVDLGKDGRRKYCDNHRELRGGNWRRKGYIKEFFRDYNPRCPRMSRKVGSGFAEHMKTHPKTGEPLFKQERIAVLKEKKRILRARKFNNFHHSEESDDTEKNTVCYYE